MARRFDPLTASLEEILDLAEELPGLTLGEIPGVSFPASEARRGKGEAGLAIERYFGLDPNPRAEADFPAAGLELKAVPIIRADGTVRSKERTFISMIDYGNIVRETWETASVRKKLNILFVFYEHLLDRPKAEFPILHVLHWEPSGHVEDQIRADWEMIRRKILHGRAHELSEADGRILGPATKGPGAGKPRLQPFSPVPAKSRGFALKPTFTISLYRESISGRLDDSRLAELTTLRHLLADLERYVGRTIGSVAIELGLRPSTAKNRASSVVLAAIRAASPIPRKELEASGLTIRTPRVGPDLYPYEAVSFPAFRHLELVAEEWADSTLLSQVEHMLFLPVLGRQRDIPPDECQILRPVYWRPSAEQLSTIEREWTMFRDLIRAGRADQLPTERETTAIHVRPHARNALDRDPIPGGGSVTKKSFWLNKACVAEILRTAPGSA